MRVLPRGRFEVIPEVADLVERLFGALEPISFTVVDPIL
jgi:hypothetical protein